MIFKVKNFLFILFLSFIFSGELEVEGDLNVTGTIESQTIESLLEQIEALEAQITALQSSNGLATRIFQTNLLSNNESFNLFTDLDATISPIDFYFLEIIAIDGITVSDFNSHSATQFYTSIKANGGRQVA